MEHINKSIRRRCDAVDARATSRYPQVALYVVARRGAITDEMRASSKVPYALMALLDCLGGLCAALGAARTPGQLQTLLSQSLVPCTMVASAVFLKTR